MTREKSLLSSLRDSDIISAAYAALKRWAIIGCPYGTPLVGGATEADTVWSRW